MRKLAWIPFLALAACGLAQDMPSPKEIMLGRRIFFAVAESIRTELKVTDIQKNKIFAIFGESLQVDGEKIMVSMGPDTDFRQMEKDAMAVLDDGQRQRLEELWIQKLGGVALADDKVSKAVGLTDDQKKDVGKLLAEGADKLMDLFHNGPGEETHKQATVLRKETGKKLEALLKEDQKKAFEALKGKAFKFKDGTR